MSEYHRLDHNSGIDQKDDDEEDEVSRSQPNSRWRPRNYTWQEILLGIMIYFALVMTALCILRFNPFQRAWGCDSDGATAEQNEFFEWKYNDNLSYHSLDPKFDHLWEWPNGTGQIAVTDPQRPKESIFVGISMFHQLHCLAHIRHALQNPQPVSTIVARQHLPHCLDYIRKAILCFADGTIELPEVVEGVQTRRVSGAGAVHQCRSSKALFELRGLTSPIEEKDLVHGEYLGWGNATHL